MASLFTLSPNSQVVELITRITSDPATTETLLVLPLTNSVGLLTITSPLSTITALPTNTVSESANVLQNGVTTTSQGSFQNSTTTGVPPLANIPFSPSYSSLTAVQSNSQSVSPKATTDTSNPSSNRLTNGTVAGIVVAVAIGLALITFLLTFLIMRRRRTATSSHRQNDSSNGYALQSWKGAQHTSQRERKEPLITGSTKRPNDMPGYLKESADDSTVRKNVGTLLDQLDLHVENFYSDEAGSNIQKIDIAKVSLFETSKLSRPLVDSLKQTSEARLFIRHALTYYTTSAISCGDRTGSSLLPDEFTGLPRNLMRNDSKDASKSGIVSPCLDSPLELFKKLICTRSRSVDIQMANAHCGPSSPSLRRFRLSISARSSDQCKCGNVVSSVRTLEKAKA